MRSRALHTAFVALKSINCHTHSTSPEQYLGCNKKNKNFVRCNIVDLQQAVDCQHELIYRTKMGTLLRPRKLNPRVGSGFEQGTRQCKPAIIGTLFGPCSYCWPSRARQFRIVHALACRLAQPRPSLPCSAPHRPALLHAPPRPAPHRPAL